MTDDQPQSQNDSGEPIEPKPWDIELLNESAERFFGLTPESDLRTLKRAYGQAIRRYRPETHPLEFQKIRAAYETLERELRYERRQPSDRAMSGDLPSQPAPHSQSTFSGTAPGAEQHVPQHSGTPQAIDQRSAILQAAVMDPAAALAELKKQPNWTPADFILAGLLNDAGLTPKRHVFLAWLVRGLKQFPHDNNLHGLIADYLSDNIADHEIPTIVQFVATTLRSGDFYSLTERLWIRLFRLKPAAEVIALLSECESCVLDSQARDSIVFDLRVLPVAAWDADEEWVRQRLAMMNYGTIHFPSGLESEYRSLDSLVTYITSYRNHPERKFQTWEAEKLHKIVSRWCKDLSATAYRDAVTWLLECVSDRSRLRNRFTVEIDRDPQSPFHDPRLLCNALPQIAERLAFEAGIPERDLSADQTWEMADALIQHLDGSREALESSAKNAVQVAWIKKFAVGFLAVSTPLGLAIATHQLLLNESVVLASVTGLLVVIITGLVGYAAYRVNWKQLGNLSKHVYNRSLTMQYQKLWQDRLFRFFQNSGIHPDELLLMVSFIARDGQYTETARLLLRILPSDTAATVLSVAQRLKT